jgi:hypothetical protein
MPRYSLRVKVVVHRAITPGARDEVCRSDDAAVAVPLCGADHSVWAAMARGHHGGPSAWKRVLLACERSAADNLRAHSRERGASGVTAVSDPRRHDTAAPGSPMCPAAAAGAAGPFVQIQRLEACGNAQRHWLPGNHNYDRSRPEAAVRRDPCSAASSARMRMVRTAAFAAENASANPGSPRHSGRTAISPTTTT